MKDSNNVKHRPPKPKPGQPRRVAHCRTAPRKHGAYGVDVFSSRAYLRLLEAVLKRLETDSTRPG